MFALKTPTNGQNFHDLDDSQIFTEEMDEAKESKHNKLYGGLEYYNILIHRRIPSNEEQQQSPRSIEPSSINSNSSAAAAVAASGWENQKYKVSHTISIESILSSPPQLLLLLLSSMLGDEEEEEENTTL